MSKTKRMSHVFNEMVVKSGRDIDTAELHFIGGGVSATFFCAQQAHHAAHAINNHDRMADEIAELRESEVKLVNETEDLKCEVEGLLELIRKNSQVFKFLSGKDNETLGAVTEKLQAFDAHLVNEALLDKYK